MTEQAGHVAIVIAEDGKLTLIEWEALEEEQELAMLRAAIGGGWLQLLRLAPDLDMWVDEEGGLRGLNRNAIAARFAASKRTLLGPLLGKAVITGGVGPQGQTTPLSAERAVQILAELSSAGAVINNKIRARTLLAATNS